MDSWTDVEEAVVHFRGAARLLLQRADRVEEAARYEDLQDFMEQCLRMQELLEEANARFRGLANACRLPGASAAEKDPGIARTG